MPNLRITKTVDTIARLGRLALPELVATFVLAAAAGLWLLIAGFIGTGNHNVVRLSANQPNQNIDFAAWESDTSQVPVRLENTDQARAAAQGDQLTVVLTDFGANVAASSQAVQELPESVLFSVWPYARDPRTIAQLLTQSGKPLMADLPMETEGFPYVDLGPRTLLREVSRAENRRVIDDIVASIGLVDTFVAIGGERFLSDTPSVNALLRELVARRISIIVPPDTDPAIASVTLPDGMSIRHADFILDEANGIDQLRNQLREVKQRLRKREQPLLVVGSTEPAVVSELAAWFGAEQ